MQVSTRALRTELEWCQRFPSKSATIPILSSILFEAKGATLNLTATDLEVGGVTTVAGQGKGKWSCAVPVAKLIKYLGKVDESEVTLSTSDDHWLTVAHGTDSTRISGMSHESYPELPQPPDSQVNLSGLALAIKRTSFAISQEESRFTLNGALIEGEGDEARIVATDGHRLSLAPVKVKGAPAFRALLPKKALLDAGRFEENCAFSCDDDHVFMSFGQRRIVTRKLVGTFPDWPRVMPETLPNHVMLPRAAMLKTLERVALYADDRSHAVTFAIADGKLTMKARSVEEGDAQGVVPVRNGEGAEPLEIGLNAEYVTDFLSRTEVANVAFAWTDGKSISVFMTGDGWKMCVMPLRID